MAPPELQAAISNVLQPIDWAGDPTKFVRLQDETVAEVEELLKQHGDVDGSTRPRTYALLHLSRLTRFHDTFRGRSDDHLPYTDWTLPGEFCDEAGCKQFLGFQHLVVSEEWQRSGPRTKQHMLFERVDDCPLRSTRLLGQGGSGTVDCVRGKYSGKSYARKVFHHGGNAAKINSFQQELEILKDVQHHHLVRFIGSYQDPKGMALTMLPIAEGDLSAWINAHLGDSLIQRFFGCLASAVAYLHRKHVRHKDIKPPNVLVCNNEILLTDFGSSGKWQDPDQSVTKGKVAYAYTRKYAPQEVMDESDRNRASDIFSLGCVFLEMMSALLGHHTTDVSQHLGKNGTCSPLYSDNEPAVDSWIDFLRTKSSLPAHLTILDTTRCMMDADKSRRPAPSTLVDRVLGLGTDFACKRCHEEPTLQYLESKHIRVAEPHARGPALCEATRTRDLDVVQHLLKVTEDLSCKADHNGTPRTALEIAVRENYFEIVQSFLSHYRDNNMHLDITGPFESAIICSSHRSFELLLDFGADPSAPYSLYLAASWGNIKALKVMVARGADLSCKTSATGRTVLHGAVRGNAMKAFDYLLTQKLDVNAKDSAGVTLFHEAAIKGREKFVAALAQAGADPNICDDGGRYPVSRAVQKNHAHMVSSLVSAGADVRRFDSKGNTAAGSAAILGKVEVLEAILVSTGPENHYDKDGRSLLHLAVQANHASVIKTLLKRTPRDIDRATNESKETPLHYAARFGSKAIVEMLLALPQVPTRAMNSLGHTPLRTAMDVRKNSSIPRLFVDRDPWTLKMKDLNGGTPLSHAVPGGSVEFVRFLVEKGADLEASFHSGGQRPLHLAALYGNTRKVRLLLDLGAQVQAQDSQGHSPLHYAACMGHGAVVKLLLQSDTPIEATDSEGLTAHFHAAINGDIATVKLLGGKGKRINRALMMASKRGELEAVQLLLDAGADINAHDSARRSPLMLAIEQGKTDIAKALVKRGCNVQKDANATSTPLILAASLDDKGTVQALIKRGAHINVPDKNGNTALFEAAGKGHTEIVRLLLAAGAKVDLTWPGNQQTPLYKAACGGHEETARMLVKKGADVRRAIRRGNLRPRAQDAVKFLKELESDRGSTSRTSQRKSRS